MESSSGAAGVVTAGVCEEGPLGVARVGVGCSINCGVRTVCVREAGGANVRARARAGSCAGPGEGCGPLRTGRGATWSCTLSGTT
jgi:hypothetical protein